MRRPTNDDADTAHNARVPRFDSGDDNPSGDSVSSQTSNTPAIPHNTRRSSMAFLSRGLGRSTSNMMAPPPDVPINQEKSQERQISKSESSTRSVTNHQRKRSVPFSLPLAREGAMTERAPHPVAVSGDSVRGSNHGQDAPDSPNKGTLKDRRNVNLELALPVGLPVLPASSRSPREYFSSLTPSRPRSPKTPFARSELPKVTHFVMPMEEPIVEEDYIGHVTFSKGNEMREVFPDNYLIGSSHSPDFEHPPTRTFACGQIPGRRSKRSRSGHSVMSEDAHPRTPNESTGVITQQARADARLEQLSLATKYSRQNRWRWARSTTSRSSDGASTNTTSEPTTRRCSMNPFKRSGRIPDQTDETRDLSPPSRLWWIGKQPAAPARHDRTICSTSTHFTVPPILVPPPLHRVPTPPISDANGEVKGKLAGFFFDHTAGLEGRRPKASPGGHWDSDALLMRYLSPELNFGQSKEDEEGPEGPVTPPAPRGFTVDHNPGYATPGLVEAPGGYLTAQRLLPLDDKPRTPFQTETWFRVRRDNSTDESHATPQRLQEIEERKKFEWFVPEHLPKSPLCPKHAAYTGYSAGICYWHGRRPSKEDDAIRMQGEIEGGVYEQGKKEKAQRAQARQDGDQSSSHRPRRGVRGWQAGVFQESPAEETSDTKKRRLASLSNRD
jgi:hypothetical protein